MVDAPDTAVWFMGDLSDPWVVSIVEALVGCAGLVQVHCPGDLPDRPFAADQPPALVVIHRQRLTALDAQRLQEYRASSSEGSPPAIVLCISPYVRYAELERWSSLADLVISEATAPDTLPCHVTRLFGGRDEGAQRPADNRVRIEVAGSNHDLCQAIVDACAAVGYRALAVPGHESYGASGPTRPPTHAVEPTRTLTIWDVPVLEPDWSERLERRARSTGPVIALLGFADREIVTIAKACGAVACLELPYNVDDLTGLIARTIRSLSRDRSPGSARAEPPHRLPPPPRRRKKPHEGSQTPVPWSDREGKPKL